MKKLILILSSLLLSSCISSQDTPDISYYSLDNTTQNIPSNVSNKTILRVMPASVVQQYSGKSFVYRTSKTNYLSDPYRQFLLAPSLQITQYLTNTMQNSLDATIVNSDSLLIASYVVQFDVSKFYADYQNKKAPLALTSINAMLYYVTLTNTTKIGEKIFSAQQSITPNNPASLIDGYNKNLLSISEDIDTWLGEKITENAKATTQLAPPP